MEDRMEIYNATIKNKNIKLYLRMKPAKNYHWRNRDREVNEKSVGILKGHRGT